MADLAFELGFDWNVFPVPTVRDGVYPLQLFLVNDAGSGTVLSTCDPSSVQTGDTLIFRIYDFTDSLEASSPQPCALQVLFTSASTIQSPTPPFSPFVFNGQPLPQLAATTFSSSPRSSIAFGSQAPGWEAQWSIGTEVVLNQAGRFNFRAFLTVGVPGAMARFYRADPEMVIGDPGGGGGFIPAP